MALPEDISAFASGASIETRPWWWRLEDASGGEVELPPSHSEYAGQRFLNQGDAESWVGEVWAELAEGGVTHVTLFEVDRKVYGPMSLAAQ